MFQENGRAILGWDAGNAFTFLKNTLNRGQVGGFICEDKGRHYRLEKAVSLLLSSAACDEKSLPRKVFVFSSKKTLRRIIDYFCMLVKTFDYG